MIHGRGSPSRGGGGGGSPIVSSFAKIERQSLGARIEKLLDDTVCSKLTALRTATCISTRTATCTATHTEMKTAMHSAIEMIICAALYVICTLQHARQHALQCTLQHLAQHTLQRIESTRYWILQYVMYTLCACTCIERRTRQRTRTCSRRCCNSVLQRVAAC